MSEVKSNKAWRLECEALRARLAEAERDAARYRLLRRGWNPAGARIQVTHWPEDSMCGDPLRGPFLDSAVDAAIAADSADSGHLAGQNGLIVTDSAEVDYEQEELERMLKQESKVHAAASASETRHE
jgi:hypothetical protein